MASSAGESKGVSFAEDTIGNNAKPKNQQLQPSRTRKQPLNKREPKLYSNDKIAANVAQYMANTNTPQEAIDTIQSDPDLLAQYKPYLIDFIKRKYNMTAQNRMTGQFKRPVSGNLDVEIEADELAKTTMDAVDSLEEAEAILKASPNTTKAVIKRALEIVGRDFESYKGIASPVQPAPAPAPAVPAVPAAPEKKKIVRVPGPNPRTEEVLAARKALAGISGLQPQAPEQPQQPSSGKRVRTQAELAGNEKRRQAMLERARKAREARTQGIQASPGNINASGVSAANKAVGAAAAGTATGEGDEAAVGPEQNNSALLNQKQPTLLRIGQDSASEYVELKGGQFKSLGGFEVVTMGLGTKEFKKLYNIKTAEQFSIMQRVFGVARLGGKPRIWTYLEQSCEFDGIPTVIAALQFRSKTLQAAIELDPSSNTSKRYKHLKDWIDATIVKLKSAKGACPVVPTAKVNVAVGPNVSGGPKNTGGPACPCLTDINLLRDLVYVMALARGNASPEVRKQIEAIPINSILEAAAGNNSSKMYPGMKATLIEIIKILRTASTAVKNGDVPEIPQDVLKTIYKALAPPETAVPDTVELDVVLGLINDIQNALDGYKHELAQAQGKEADCEEQDAELVYLRALKDDLEEKLANANDGLHRLNEIVEHAQAYVNDLSAQLEDCEGEKAKQATRIAALEAELARMAEEKTADETAAGDAHAAALAEKQKEIDALNIATDLLNRRISELQKELDAAKAVASEVEDLRAKLAACETEKGSLATELATAKARVSELEDELAELARSTMSSKNKSTQARTALEEQLKKWKETVAELTTKDTEQQAQIAALAQQVKGQLSELEQLRLRVAELQGEKDRANSEKARANAAEAASTGKNTEIAGLKTNLGNAKAALTEREAMAAVAAAELAAARAALEDQRQQRNTNVANAKAAFETQLAQEKAKLADCEAAAEAAKKKHETDLAELNAKLTEAQRVLAELQELADKTKGEQAATQQQLDTALAKVSDLEGQIKSMSSTGAEQQSSFEAERAGFRARIKELEAQLEADRQMAAGTEAELQKEASALKARISELQTQHAKEVQALKDEQATKNRAAKTAQNTKVAETEAAKQAELDSKEAEIRQLKDELAAKQAQLGIITEKNAAIAAKNALIIQQKGQIEEGNKALAEVLAKQGTLTATITELEAKLGALEGEKTSATNQRSKNAAEIQSLKAQLASALNQKRTNDTQLQKLRANLGAAPKQTNVDALTAQLSQAKDQLSQITAKLAEVEAAKGSEIATTSAALQNALAELAVSKEQQDALAKAAKGDMSGLQDIKKETCDFFFFLYDTINLQLRNIQKMNIPDALRADIFKMYNLADSYATINKQELLNELSLIFQEFFYKFNTLTGAGGKGLPLQSSYPLLSEIVKNTRLTDDKGACSLTPKEQFQIREQLQMIGYQYQFGIVPNAEGDKLSIIPKPASSDLCRDTKHEHDHYVPLTVLAIRMIQLLHETFEGRYKELKARCLPSNVAAAVEVRPAEETA